MAAPALRGRGPRPGVGEPGVELTRKPDGDDDEAGEAPAVRQVVHGHVLDQRQQPGHRQHRNAEGERQRKALERIQFEPPGEERGQQVAGGDQQREECQPGGRLQRQKTRQTYESDRIGEQEHGRNGPVRP